jgi:hypothetical protein
MLSRLLTFLCFLSTFGGAVCSDSIAGSHTWRKQLSGFSTCHRPSPRAVQHWQQRLVRKRRPHNLGYVLGLGLLVVAPMNLIRKRPEPGQKVLWYKPPDSCLL